MQKLKQLKRRGILMITCFLAVLVVLFMPIFPDVHNGKVNGLNYLDNFFNQLSKGSANYIDEQRREANEYIGTEYSASLKMVSNSQADRLKSMLSIIDITAETNGQELLVKGDFGAMITSILQDADLMYRNDSDGVKEKYGTEGMVVLYDWYQMFEAMENDLKRSGLFPQAQFIKKTMTKALEPAYNYYTIDVKPVREEIVPLALALIFYVTYTVWYGFGLLYIFEGLGIKLEH